MIWLLWHRRVGDLNQMKVLAEALGQPYVIKQLQFRKPLYAPFAKLLFEPSTSDNLNAPWPDAIICAEALCSVIAKDIKQQSGGILKIVALARPAGDPCAFDLVLTTAQYSLPRLPNVITLALPLTAAAEFSQRNDSKSIAVLIGGNSPPDRLDLETISRLIVDVKAYAKKTGTPLIVITSPRTPLAVVKTLQAEIQQPHQLHIWPSTAENTYTSVLNRASEIIVTSDSVSMLADALVCGKPTQVYKLPQRFSTMKKLVNTAYRNMPKNILFRSAVLEAISDRTLLVDRLVDQGHVAWFGEELAPFKTFDRTLDINTAVSAVRQLLAR